MYKIRKSKFRKFKDFIFKRKLEKYIYIYFYLTHCEYDGIVENNCKTSQKL